MNATEIIESMTSDGLSLSVSEEGNLKILGDQDTVNKWMDTIRENKSAILAELDTSGKSCQRQNLPSSQPLQDLHPCKPCTPLEACNVTETLPHDASAMRTHSDGKYSLTCTDASTDPVLVEVTIAGQASFTLQIPKRFYNGIALLELLEKHNAQTETQGIDSRRAA